MSAIILAGGESSRFGTDKAFAKWEGKPFLARVAAAVQPVADQMIVLAPLGARGLEYARLAPGATIIPDRQPHAGPVAALKGAIALAQGATVLVVPVDAPGLPTGLARRLVALCEENGRPTVAQAPQGRLWSLFAIASLQLRERLASAKRLEDLLADAEGVETDAAGLNVNEPPPMA